jgi:acyl dehydratase
MPVDPALVGHETPRQTYIIQPDDIAQFGDAIGDTNAVFRDPARARDAGFPTVIATPTFVTRFRMPLHEIDLDPHRSQILHAEQEYEYARPLHAGDQVVTWYRLAAVRQSSRGDGMAIMTIENLGETLAGEHLYTGTSMIIVRDGSPGAGVGERQRATRPTATPEGQPIGPLIKHVTQPQIDAYAEASGDHNPIHVNPDAARAVGLDGTIAHGMLSMGFLGQLITDWLAELSAREGWLARLRVRFHAMVRPEDTLTCRGVLVAGSEGGRQSMQVWAENQHGDRVTSGEAEVMLGER